MYPKVSVFVGLSLDGFIAGEGGDLSWMSEGAAEDVEETGYAELMREVDTLVIGRNTYEVVERFSPWPYAGKRVAVMTTRALPTSAGVTAVQGTLPDVLRELAAQGSRHAYLDGGNVIRQGMAAGRVDVMTLSFLPVTLGRGIPLFGPEVPFARWKLEKYRAFASGLVQARYVR